jgi:hypothetical protein
MSDVQEALATLRHHREAARPLDIRASFADDPERFERFSLGLDDLLLDYSKCAVTAETMRLLMELARAAGLEERRAAMFAGEPINVTEGRAALHVALRNHSDRPMTVDGRPVRSREEGRALIYQAALRNVPTEIVVRRLDREIPVTLDPRAAGTGPQLLLLPGGEGRMA